MTYYAEMIDAALRSWPATFRQSDDTSRPTITFEQRPFARLYRDAAPFFVKVRLTPEQQQQASAENAGETLPADDDPHGEWRLFFANDDDATQLALNWLKVAYDEMMRQELAGRKK